MKIHNIYSDLMLALSNHINSFLSPKIKSFQYNLANVSFSLNLSPQFELPTAIIKLNATEPFINHPYVFQHNNLTKNCHQIPILYDRTKDIEISLQEEIYKVTIDILINCESQIQAINLNHLIINFTPINKPLHLFEFFSFFELDSTLLTRFLIDVDNDQIQNLFLKHNRYSDTLDYCFSVNYNPIVKLLSSSVGIDNISAGTFQVSTSYEIMAHLPIHLKHPGIGYSLNILPDHKLLYYSNLPVGVQNLPYLLLELNNKIITEVQIIPILNILDNGQFQIDFSYGQVIGSLSNKITEYVSVLVYNNLTFNCNVIETYNYNTLITQYVIDGDISGRLRNVTIEDNIISGWFSGFISNRIVEIHLKFNIINIFLDYKLQTFTTTFTDYQVLNYRLISNKRNIISDFILKINRFAVKLEPTKSSISSILIFDKNLNQFKTIDFLIPIPATTQILIFNYNSINYSIPININSDTLKIGLGQLTPNLNLIDLIAFNFNELEFIYINNLHSGYIESVNIDFTFNNEVISDIVPFQKYGQQLFTGTNIVLSSIDSEYDAPNLKYKVKILLDNIWNIDIFNISWRFIWKDIMFQSDTTTQIVLDVLNSSPTGLQFIVDEGLYMKIFNRVTRLNPLYFSIVK